MTKENGEEDLRRRLHTAREIHGPNEDWDRVANQIVAQNVLHSDLGYHSDYLPTYALDNATRDRLLAHARQDAAHVVSNTISLMREVRWLKRNLYSLCTFLVGLSIVSAIAFLLFRR